MGLAKDLNDAACECGENSSPSTAPPHSPTPTPDQKSTEIVNNYLDKNPRTLSAQIRTEPSTTEVGGGGDDVQNSRVTVCLICRCRQKEFKESTQTQGSKTKKINLPSTSVPSMSSLVKSRLVNSFNYKVANQVNSSKITKKYRKSRLRLVKRREYKRLREMVPVLQEKDKVSKVEVIEEAIKYIDELHDALVQRFRARGLPPLLSDVNLDPRNIDGGNIRDLIRRLLASNNPASLPPSRIENVRVTPSFLQKTNRSKKS